MTQNELGQKKIMLIHGQGRSPLAMMLLGWRLRRHQVYHFGYLCFYEALADIRQRFVQTLKQKMNGGPYIVVGHSLGGIITRASLPYLVDMLPQHLIMLAPPNRPAKLAQRMGSNAIYRLFTGDCGQKLADDLFYQTLPPPPIPTTIIAGTRGIYGPLSPFDNQPNDMVLSVEETKLEANTKVILVPATHAFIMNSPQVAKIILDVVAGDSKRCEEKG